MADTRTEDLEKRIARLEDTIGELWARINRDAEFMCYMKTQNDLKFDLIERAIHANTGACTIS